MTAPTAAQARALTVLAERGPDVTAHQAARLLYPDNPAWRKAGHRHDGKAGANGATLWLTAGRLLWALHRRGWASIEWTDTSQVMFSITEAGREALRGCS